MLGVLGRTGGNGLVYELGTQEKFNGGGDVQLIRPETEYERRQRVASSWPINGWLVYGFLLGAQMVGCIEDGVTYRHWVQ